VTQTQSAFAYVDCTLARGDAKKPAGLVLAADLEVEQKVASLSRHMAGQY
jgi:hypothetical protein